MPRLKSQYAGTITASEFNKALKQTEMWSENVIEATRRHLVGGVGLYAACKTHKIQASQLMRARKLILSKVVK